MASRLFHAVVGFGISLGTATGCGGAVTDDALPDGSTAGSDAGPELDVGLSDAAASTEGGSPEAAASSDGGAEAGAFDVLVPDAPAPDAGPRDAEVPDAPQDGSEDAVLEAFCDVTWPITKSGREVCGPADECQGKLIPWCYGPDDEGACVLYPMECVGAEWQCMGGSLSTESPTPPEQCQ